MFDTFVRSVLPADAPCPHRRIFIGAESLIAISGVAGAVQLVSGTLTPPVSDLAPLGLSSWILPGAWLFATVAVPSSAAAWLAWRRAPLAPTAVLVASGTLALEIGVQIPFIGTNVLQAVFGSVAVGMAALAIHARRTGW